MGDRFDRDRLRQEAYARAEDTNPLGEAFRFKIFDPKYRNERAKPSTRSADPGVSQTERLAAYEKVVDQFVEKVLPVTSQVPDYQSYRAFFHFLDLALMPPRLFRNDRKLWEEKLLRRFAEKQRADSMLVWNDPSEWLRDLVGDIEYALLTRGQQELSKQLRTWTER